jgi:hypothetical protein
VLKPVGLSIPEIACYYEAVESYLSFLKFRVLIQCDDDLNYQYSHCVAKSEVVDKA